jgi:hypothetical protein
VSLKKFFDQPESPQLRVYAKREDVPATDIPLARLEDISAFVQKISLDINAIRLACMGQDLPTIYTQTSLLQEYLDSTLKLITEEAP